MASSILLKFPRNTEVMETKKTESKEALERMRYPLQKTQVSLTVNGVFSLPEAWKAKLDDPTESMFEYQIEMAGIRVKHSKIIPRELTEEEKAEADAKNSKKKPEAPKKG